MRTYRTACFDRLERSILERVAPSVSVVVADVTGDDEMAVNGRAIRALASGTDCTWELASKAAAVLRLLVAETERTSSVEFWTIELSTTSEPITKDTPGGGLIADPYGACTYLADLRTAQCRDAKAALALVEKALSVTDPRRPSSTKESE